MTNNKSSRMGAFLSGALVASAVAGYTLFVSKNSKRNRDQVEDWVEKARVETLEKIKKLKSVSKEKYNEIVDSVSDKYAKMKEIGQDKADQFRAELKKRWEEIEEEEREKTTQNHDEEEENEDDLSDLDGQEEEY